MKPNSFLKLFFLLIIITSCQTNKAPDWIENPPEDNEMFIYVVGVGKGDSIFQSVIDQLRSRFSLAGDERFDQMVKVLLQNAYNSETIDSSKQVAIIDRWTGESSNYILARFNRELFDYLLDLYSDRYHEIKSYLNVDVLKADALYKNGELYASVKAYLDALDFMLKQNDPFYTNAIKDVLDKLYTILSSIGYKDIEFFDLLTIAVPVGDTRFYLSLESEGNQKFDGFLFDIDFVEGWSLRNRSVTIPVRDNSLVFTPPVPKVSGAFSIKSELNADAFWLVIDPWLDRIDVGTYLVKFRRQLIQIVKKSLLINEYDAVSDLSSFVKIISFNNKMLSEGIMRFLLEKEESAVLSPLIYSDDSLLSYIREVNKATEGIYTYMILGGDIEESREIYDDGLLVTLEGDYSLVDLHSSTIILTKKITSEFITQSGDVDPAYLDLGLKIGEIIYSLSY